MKIIRINVPDMVYDVAEVLRQSYYENQEATLLKSKHPLQWTRMAEAAIAKVEAAPLKAALMEPNPISMDDIDKLSGN